MKVVVDTNAYVALCSGNARVLELLESAEQVHVPTIVIGELMSGFFHAGKREANVAGLDRFLEKPGVSTLDINRDIAEKYALLTKHLKAAGTPLPTHDVWVAAGALSLGAAVLTRDTLFEKIMGLDVIGF